VQNVTAWLEELGLAKYAASFVQNEIDFQALSHLTESMLAELGLPIGPRAKLLAAIAAMRDSTETRSQAPSGVATVHPQAERRQITILFADLADSTKLAMQLDPEDLGSLMQAYQQAAGAAIEHCGGHIAQYMGDGIVAYFGWPTAQEDAGERAVRAGLDIVEAIKAIKSAESLVVRVGINTGIVVISDTGKGDPSIPLGAVGATPHIAARLQALAAPNSVVISGTTSHLVAHLCDLEDLGPQNLKGVAESVPVFGVKRLHTSRFLAGRARGLTPFVGRQAELALLLQRWHDAKEGEGQVVYVSGVPGIGKSRIVYELEQRINEEGHHRRLKFQCAPHTAQSALFPIIQGLAWQAKLHADDAREVKLDKLKGLLSLSLGTEQIDKALPLFAEAMSVPVDLGVPRRPLTAQQAKDQTLLLLVDLVIGLSTHGAVLCLLEDAQWIDASTQELLELLAGRIKHAQILFVVTNRPEYRPRVGDHGNVSTLAIARLARRDVAELARLALHHHTDSNGLLAKILDNADAIPLYIEELSRGAVASAAPSVTASDTARTPSISAVPDVLRDSLMARLDRVPQGRRVAEIASVIGREFSYAMLRDIAPLDGPELDATLASLVKGEIIQQIEREPFARFAFTHALLRDVAYESLLKSRRREIHAKVADAIQRESPEVGIAQPELLAFHYGEAGHAESAVRYWLAGSRRARSRWANLEAIAQLQRALEFAKLLASGLERIETELEIHLALGLSFIAVRGYSSDETRHSFEQACELCTQLHDPKRTIQALFGLWGYYWMTARHDRAMEIGQTLLVNAESLNDPAALIVGHRVIGSTLFTLGEFVEARKHLEQVLSLAASHDAAAVSASHFAVSPRIAAQLLLAWDLWILGYPDQALEHVLQAVELATRLEEHYGGAFGHCVASIVYLLRGDPLRSLEEADQSHALSTEHRFNLYVLYSRFSRGCALVMLAQHHEAMAEISAAIEGANQIKFGYMRGFMLDWLAKVRLATGDREGALSTINDALANVNTITGRAWEAELHRMRGEILLSADAGAQASEQNVAERCFSEALAVARRQQARSIELRAAISLAKLLLGQRRSDEARSVLEPIVNWFTEGFDTADVREAKGLLERLGKA
jgi:class 3 adenylate cyclase/tetratricopeptide (TPR) repeat protein